MKQVNLGARGSFSSPLGWGQRRLSTRMGRGGVAACLFIPSTQIYWTPPMTGIGLGTGYMVLSRAKDVLIVLL